MHPRFRSDLTCSREEQQGVVFYRIDDPETRTSFRLYEIEYLIAQKLDGARTIPEVIDAVKDEYNFDISEADLNKFVNQLESMGFIDGTGPKTTPGAPPPNDSSAAEPTQPVCRPQREDAPTAPDASLLDGSSSKVDLAELNRLLRSAFLHVKQGYVVHARDYFLAARELDPQNERLAKLVGHLNAIGDANGEAEVEYLWRNATELFPDIAESVGAVTMSDDGTPAEAAVVDAAERSSEASEQDFKTRLRLTIILLLVVVGGFAGLLVTANLLGVFDSAARVKLASLTAEAIPIFHKATATQVTSVQEKALSFGSAGVISDAFPMVGERVQQGQIIALLELKPKNKKGLDKARKAVEAAEAKYEKARQKLAQLLTKREEIKAARAEVEERLQALKPTDVRKQDAAKKREIETLRKERVRANKKLSQLTKKERGPRQQETKLKKKLEAARKKLEAAESRIQSKIIRAPFVGDVIALNAKPGQNVEANTPVLTLRNPLQVRLEFNVKETGSLQQGGEAMVAVGRGAPSAAKVAAVNASGNGTNVLVDLEDPAGTFLGMAPNAFRLVRKTAERAFRVPVDAVAAEEEGDTHYVVVALDSRALRHHVQILQSDAAETVVEDPQGALRDGAQIVSMRLDSNDGISTIEDGAFLAVEE